MNKKAMVLKSEKFDNPQHLRFHEISWGDCLRYGTPYEQNKSDNQSIEQIVVNSSSKTEIVNKFYKKVYFKKDCQNLVTFEGKPLIGLYRIDGINPPVLGNQYLGVFLPEYILAKFINGKRSGKWEYYGSKIELRPSEILTPIKIEIYKNGLPDGEWWQKSQNKIEYFQYKKGVLISSRDEIFKK